MTRWGKAKTDKGLSVASRAKAYLPPTTSRCAAPDEALIYAWHSWLTEAMQHIDELEAELGGGKEDPKEETAEEVLRANAKIHPGYGDEHVVSGFTRDHAREILDVLDAARETVSALKASLRAANAVARSAQNSRDSAERELLQLRTQSKVDVDAVLAPLRKLRDDVGRSRAQHDSRVQSYCYTKTYDRAHEHMVQRDALEVVIKDMDTALAEADKIGRGE